MAGTEARPGGDAAGIRRFPRAVALLALAGTLLLATWKLTLGDRIIARGDLLLYFYPLRDFAAQAVRDARLPLWNPYTFMGAPFLANSQAGFFYPFNILTAWLSAERAVNANIILHFAIAAGGMYGLARGGLKLARLAAFCAAIAFALGGYFGAQVEHFNQFQALAWLPLQTWIVIATPGHGPRRWLAGLLGLALLLALQVAAGHTQSLYICVFALGAVAVWDAALSLRAGARRAASPLLLVAAAGALAALLSAAQLLPTLELARESARSGGLSFNDNGAFSWRPWVVARALLPTFGDPLFAEYVAYLGVTGVNLALLGALAAGRARHGAGMALMLTALGGILALGVATPLFGVMHTLMPGFNLFRAQARWLIVFSLGASLLIGFGVQSLRDGLTARAWRVWAAGFAVAVAALAAGAWLGARFSPEPEYRALPAAQTLAGWFAALAVNVALLAIARACNTPVRNARLASACAAALVLELLTASQFQPYARAADGQALTSLRPATAYLLAAKDSDSRGSGRGDGRVLSLSSLLFDPGDRVEQMLLYQPWLSADELYDRLIASKHKEILSPNLSLYYGLPSADGYDGGLLPLRRYIDFTSPFVARERPGDGADGRLREFLRRAPAGDWLEKMAVRYLIADKTADVFFDGVYYDTLFPTPISTTRAMSLTPYASTALGIVLDAPGLLDARITFDDGSAVTARVDAVARSAPNTGLTYGHAIARWDGRRTPVRVELSSPGRAALGLTSIDAGDGTFLSQPPRDAHPAGWDMRLAYSGDVKIYENLRPAARAVLRQFGRAIEDGARIVEDLPERVVVDIAAPAAGADELVLRDACYPGWVARVDGVATPITCADGMFRTVALGRGARQVAFTYEPESVRAGLLLSGIGLALMAGLAAGLVVEKKRGAA